MINDSNVFDSKVDDGNKLACTGFSSLLDRNDQKLASFQDFTYRRL